MQCTQPLLWTCLYIDFCGQPLYSWKPKKGLSVNFPSERLWCKSCKFTFSKEGSWSNSSPYCHFERSCGWLMSNTPKLSHDFYKFQIPTTRPMFLTWLLLPAAYPDTGLIFIVFQAVNRHLWSCLACPNPLKSQYCGQPRENRDFWT